MDKVEHLVIVKVVIIIIIIGLKVGATLAVFFAVSETIELPSHIRDGVGLGHHYHENKMMSAVEGVRISFCII